MLTIDQLTDAQRDRLTRVSTAYGTTPERLLAAMQRRETQDRDDRTSGMPHPVVTQRRKNSRFHFGESTIGYRR